MSNVLLWVIGILCVGVVFFLVATRTHMAFESRALLAASRPYTQSPEQPVAHVLVIGDSTAVGTGAASDFSVAGRLGAEFSDIHIENRAVNGAVVQGVHTQLREAARERYALVVIHAGANDVLRFRNIDDTAAEIDALLASASERAEQVVFLTAGNIGLAPAFFPPLSYLYTARTKALRARVLTLAKTHDVAYVDLFKPRSEDIFLRDIQRYYAPDGLHLSAEGYGYWYEQIRLHIDAAALGKSTVVE